MQGAAKQLTDVPLHIGSFAVFGSARQLQAPQ
jgi:hypothetical protein